MAARFSSTRCWVAFQSATTPEKAVAASPVHDDWSWVSWPFSLPI